MEKKKIILIIILMQIILISLFAETDSSTEKKGAYLGLNFFMPVQWDFSGYLLLKYKDKLELSESQIQKIKKIIIDYKEYSIRNAAEIKIKELKLAFSIRQEKIDRKEVDLQIRSLSQNKTDQVIKSMHYCFDLRAVLNESQRKEFKKLCQENNRNKTPHPQPDQKEIKFPYSDIEVYFY